MSVFAISPPLVNAVDEGNTGSTPVSFTVTRVGGLGYAAAVDWAVTGTGSNPAAPADFGGGYPSGTLNFASGVATADIVVNIKGDTSLEPDEGFTVTLSNPRTFGIATPAAATAFILNDDAVAAPVLTSLALSNSSIPENSAPGTSVGAILNVTAGSTLTLTDDAGGRFAISSGFIVAGATGTDYEAAASHNITITETLAGATGSPKPTTISIAVGNLNDTNPNAFTLNDVSSASVSTVQTSNTITIAGLGASDTVVASISGAASSQMQKNGGSWGAGPFSVVNGDTIAVRHTSSATNSTAVSTTLTIGTRSDTFTSTTTATGAVYDTAVGNGVDSNGFAALPLRTGGTDGAEVITAAPTSKHANATWNNSTKTLSVSPGVVGTLATWSGVTTANTDYHIVISYNITSFAGVRIKDNLGNVLADIASNGTGSSSGFLDILAHTSGTGLVFEGYDDLMTGSLIIHSVKSNSGGLGARRFFVRPSTGNDANNGVQAQSAATPLATLAKALAYAEHSRGDQILIAEGSTFASSTALPQIKISGFSALYPLVLQSYDPADPTNEAKYGRAVGTARPKFTGLTGTTTVTSGGGSSNAVRYLVIRGLEFNPGNISGPSITFTPGGGATPVEYALLENNIFAYTHVAFDLNALGGVEAGAKLIVRNNSFYGAWNSDPAVHAQGIYVDNTFVTVEDNTFYHNGWKIGAARGDSVASGGVTIFRHPCYLQDNTDGIFRRNLSIDGCADGGSLRGDINCQENVVLDCPVGLGLGSGTGYDVTRPAGVTITAAYNAILGSSDLYPIGSPDSNGLRGWGMSSLNGKPGSVAHHNLLAQGTKGINSWAFQVAAQYNQPSYMDWHDNVAYNWTVSGQTIASDHSSFPAQVHETYSNNYWDDPASGTNLNKSSLTVPNAYTVTTLAAALGYASKQALIDDVIAHPENHVQRTARSLLFAGYNVPA